MCVCVIQPFVCVTEVCRAACSHCGFPSFGIGGSWYKWFWFLFPSFINLMTVMSGRTPVPHVEVTAPEHGEEDNGIPCVILVTVTL